MVDITMCNVDDCPVKDSCYRHTAKPTMLGDTQYQSYFVDDPRDTVHSTSLDEYKVCHHWLPWCPNCQQEVEVLLKMGGQICEKCRRILRLPSVIPKEVYQRY